MHDEFLEVTEKVGDPVTRIQLTDMYYRYRWAAEYSRGKRVFEAACGTGQGLGLLARYAGQLSAGDVAPAAVEIAERTYGGQIQISVIDAHRLPQGDGEVDVVILFEAIYYLSSPDAFLRESARVLAPRGHVLLTMTNKDVRGFVPSVLSRTYLGVPELARLLARNGFVGKFSGYSRLEETPLRQRLAQPLKLVAHRFGLLPRRMQGKALLRRLLFGRLLEMPADISSFAAPYAEPKGLSPTEANTEYRYIFCAAQKMD